MYTVKSGDPKRLVVFRTMTDGERHLGGLSYGDILKGTNWTDRGTVREKATLSRQRYPLKYSEEVVIAVLKKQGVYQLAWICRCYQMFGIGIVVKTSAGI